MRSGPLAALILVAAVSLPSAQRPHASHASLPAIPLELLQKPTSLREGIGIAREAVETGSPEALALYQQGLAYLHSFVWIEAARSFHAALRLNPQLAMGHLGLSFAYGGLGSSQGARESLARARALAPAAGERDRLRIALRGQQLDSIERPDSSALAAYRAALDRALAQDPDDVELLLLRGQAATGNGAASAMASDEQSVAYYERAAAAAPDEFAAHHYLVHAYETVGLIDQALAESERYVRMAPAVPHAHHMHAHGLSRASRTREALAAYQKADALEAAYFRRENISPELDWHHHHNQVLMAAAHRRLGQLRSAGDRLKSVFELRAPLMAEELSKREYPALLLAAGLPGEALEATERLVAHPSPVLRAAGHLSAAQVHMARGDLKRAGLAADAALRELRSAGPDAAALVSDLRLVQGEFLLRAGDQDSGRRMIREGVGELRADPGPDAWSRTTFQLEALGRAAREAGDWTLAGELAREMTRHDPSFAGTAYARARLAEQRGETADATSGYADAVRAWTEADFDLADLSDARRRLTTLRGALP